MDILILLIGINQFLVAAHVREDPQFDLGIVRVRKQHSFRGDEGFSDLLAHFCLHGNILEIGIRRADPSRRRYRLVETCMDPPILRHISHQAVRVRGFKFGNRPVLQYIFYYGIVGRKFFKDARRCGVARPGLLTAGHSKLLKEDNAELLGRSDIELFPAGFIDPAGQFVSLLAELSAVIPQSLGPDPYPDSLHVMENIA